MSMQFRSQAIQFAQVLVATTQVRKLDPQRITLSQTSEWTKISLIPNLMKHNKLSSSRVVQRRPQLLQQFQLSLLQLLLLLLRLLKQQIRLNLQPWCKLHQILCSTQTDMKPDIHPQTRMVRSQRLLNIQFLPQKLLMTILKTHRLIRPQLSPRSENGTSSKMIGLLITIMMFPLPQSLKHQLWWRRKRRLLLHQSLFQLPQLHQLLLQSQPHQWLLPHNQLQLTSRSLKWKFKTLPMQNP